MNRGAQIMTGLVRIPGTMRDPGIHGITGTMALAIPTTGTGIGTGTETGPGIVIDHMTAGGDCCLVTCSKPSKLRCNLGSQHAAVVQQLARPQYAVLHDMTLLQSHAGRQATVIATQLITLPDHLPTSMFSP